MTDPGYHAVAFQLDRFGKRRVKRVLKLCRDKGGPFTGDLMLAIASRETELENIVGDFGHGRGIFQEDDRFQTDWLRRQIGAVSGTWLATKWNALRAGFVPLLVPALRHSRKLLSDARVWLIRHGVPESSATKVAVASYNAGPTGALNGFNRRNPDEFTAGGDYSHDVFQRRIHVRRWIQENGLARHS